MAVFDGRGSAQRLEPERECRQCGKTGQVYYVGSDVLHGNPFTPAADTEVEHHYECQNCGHTWSRVV